MAKVGQAQAKLMDATDPMRMMCNACEGQIENRYIWFSNQHGIKIRFFCRACGAWEDRKLLYSGPSLECRWVPGHDPNAWL